MRDVRVKGCRVARRELARLHFGARCDQVRGILGRTGAGRRVSFGLCRLHFVGVRECWFYFVTARVRDGERSVVEITSIIILYYLYILYNPREHLYSSRVAS